jgi:hypothetical protein
MLRLFIVLTLLLINSYACDGGYQSCKSKIIHSDSIKNNTLSIPISKNKRLLYSRVKPHAKILKYDRFLSLYLIEDSKGFPFPFKINMKQLSGMANIDKRYAKEGRLIRHQIGLNKLGVFSAKLKAPTIITNSCCDLEGIVTHRGVIEKVYINRFITKKDIRYGDIGIRVKDTKNGVVVESFNPFTTGAFFKIGDRILNFDGKKVRYSYLLMQKILFSKIGSTHNIKIKRADKILTIKTKSFKRTTGGGRVETYLESYGLHFDKNLVIIALDKNKDTFGLKLGDRLMRVNKYYVKNSKDVLKNISKFKSHPTLLFERNKNFQFFVNLK